MHYVSANKTTNPQINQYTTFMRLLFYGLNYHPELTGIGKYTGEACERLAAQAHDVEVITTPPYYPAWQVNKEYRGKNWYTETLNGVKVHRCPFYIPKKVTAVKRILMEMTFITSSLVYWLPKFFSKKPDAVVCVVHPFQLGMLPLIYRKIRGVPFVYHIQDLQIDIADEMGMIKNKTLFKIMYKMERYIMDNAVVVSSISDGMLNKIRGKQLKRDNTYLFPNWVDTKFIKSLSKQDSLLEKLGYSLDDFIVLYSGNMGEKQGLEIVIEAADLLKDNARIKFVMVGEGNTRTGLENSAKEKKLENIRFFPLQPYADLPKLLAMADIHLVLQKKSASDLVLPSKLTGILSAGGVAIISAGENSYLYNEVKQNNLGVTIAPENGKNLSDAILSLMNDTAACDVYRANALKYSAQYLDKDSILTRFENLLKTVASNEQ